jgi:hypothetical protein
MRLRAFGRYWHEPDLQCCPQFCRYQGESGRDADRSEAHILAMDQILPRELSAFEFESLRQIAAHPTAHHVPSRVQSRLKDIGYVKEVLGSLIVTDDGLQRIALNK